MTIGTSKSGRPYRASSSTALVCFVALSIWACSGDQSGEATLSERARNDNLSSSGLQLTKSDLNGDGAPDQWVFFDAASGQVVRVERDIDFDDRIDVYEYYDEAGELVEEEMHLDFDGLIDVVRYYRGDALARREIATGFDGRFAMVKYYDAEGNVLRVERDSTGNGRIDTWEYFDGDTLVRVGRDTDGDGRPELVDSAP